MWNNHLRPLGQQRDTGGEGERSSGNSLKDLSKYEFQSYAAVPWTVVVFCGLA
jgi:hypothetical protein